MRPCQLAINKNRLRIGRRYAFAVRREGHEDLVRDPLGRRFTTDEAAHSVLWDLDYPWDDDAWMRARAERSRATPRLVELSADDWERGGVDDLYDRILALTGPRGGAQFAHGMTLQFEPGESLGWPVFSHGCRLLASA